MSIDEVITWNEGIAKNLLITILVIEPLMTIKY
jgi:hypothetical protein